MSYSDSDSIELLEYEYIVDIIFRVQHMIRAIKYNDNRQRRGKSPIPSEHRKPPIDEQQRWSTAIALAMRKQQIEDSVNILFSWLKPLTDLYKQMKEMFDNKLFKSLSPSADTIETFKEESNRVKNRMITNIEELKTYTKVLTSEEFDVFEDMLRIYDKAITSFISEVSKPI